MIAKINYLGCELTWSARGRWSAKWVDGPPEGAEEVEASSIAEVFAATEVSVRTYYTPADGDPDRSALSALLAQIPDAELIEGPPPLPPAPKGAVY